MNKNGFTLVELMAVLVIIGLLLVLTIPNIVKISKQSKAKAYDTKINLIEQMAVYYGMDNKSLIMKGQTPNNNVSSTVKIVSDDKGYITSFTYNANKAYSPTEILDTNEYRGNYVTIKELVEAGQIKWDKEHMCENCTEANKEYYNNIVVNPITDNIINGCYVYIYYKNNQVNAYFDKSMCDQASSTPGYMGKEYNPVRS
jgi:competence protein ComGC